MSDQRGRARTWARGWVVAAVLAAGCGGESDTAQSATAESEEPVIDFVQEGVWSPRGDRLLVTWNQGGRERLFGVLGPDTTGSASEPGSGLRVSDGPDARGSWSPDGLWVAFGSVRDGQGEIYRMRPDGVQVERLSDDPAHDSDPAYSPDGSRIAFVSTRTDGVARLHIMNADGSNVSFVGSAPGIAHANPEWAPDGSRLAVQVTMDDGEYIFLATPEGGWGRVKGGASPSWAANGDDIFFARNDSILVARTSSGSLGLVLADGTAPRASPDGRWLSFVRGAYPQSSLYALDLVNGNVVRLTR